MLPFLTQPGIFTALAIVSIAATAVMLALQLLIDRGARTPRPDSDRDRARWWLLRTASTIALVGAWGVVTMRGAQGIPFKIPSSTLLMTSIAALSIQWFNVWFVVWPGVRFGGPKSFGRAIAALRLNNALVVPVVFFCFVAIYRTDLGGRGTYRQAVYWMGTAGAFAALEAMVIVLPGVVRVLMPLRLVALAVGCALLSTLWLIKA